MVWIFTRHRRGSRRAVEVSKDVGPRDASVGEIRFLFFFLKKIILLMIEGSIWYPGHRLDIGNKNM